MAQHQSQNSEDTELYDPNQIQGGNVSQLTSGVRVPSQSTQGNMIMHQHISVNSKGSYASQRGTVSQGHAAVQGSSQNIQGNLPVHLQGMTNMSQGGLVSQVPTIVGGPYPNISGNAYVPESVPTCTSLQSAYLTNSQGQINSSMVQPMSPRGQLQHNLSRESQDEIRDWLTSRPSFSDRTFQERNMNTYSAYKARKASQKNSPVKAATQERIMVQQTENVMVSTDPYAFHGSQSQGLYQPNPAEINTAGVTVPTHHNPIPPLHHDTPVSTRKKRRPATRKKVTTRTRQHPIAKVHFSDQITTTASAAIETGAVIGQSTRMPMHSPSTSSSSDKSPRVPPLHRSSFTTPVMQSPHPPSVLAPPTSLHHTPGRSRMTDTTPSSTSAPEVDLNWVFTPSPDLTALVNLTEKSDVQQKNAIVAQMSGQPSFEIVSKIAVTGTMVKHFILREKYHGGVRKGYVVEEEEDKADIRTKYQTEVIPPVDYISPSRSTSTVSTGDLGDISSFSSGSIRSNMERSGSSLETTASLSSTVAPPVDTSRGMAVSSTTAESDIVMTTGNTGRDKNVITIAPLPSVTSTSTAPPKGQLKCSTPREDTHKGTPSLSPKQSLPSSVEADHSPQEASTIEKSGSRLFDETHQSSDLFAGTSEASADKGDTEGGKEDPVADEEGGDASGRGKKQKKTVVKRGRGRPRRTTAAAVQEVEVLEEDEADEEEKDKGDNVEEKSTSGSDKVSISCRPKPKKRRTDLTLNERYKVLKLLDQKLTQKEVGLRMVCSQSQVSRVSRNKEKILKLYNSSLNNDRRRQRNSKAPDVEEALLQWYRKNKCDKSLLTAQLLAEKSVELAKKLNYDDFVPSNGWISRWKLKYNLLIQRPQKGKDSED
ncbi:hypothetical protein FSP39_024988 [Pinctada imbricata]|uniref:HTH CENPB-type domain-containing protein n=1 Tax=Pinctada imbricata TaxID=66713 RepID=A0AA88YJB5_PINIB|nr:hypothetical protein FSP39_024988 [Pinctada imbricata]